MTDGPRGLSFGTMAEEYDRWRPSYPAAAVEWLAPSAPATVVEVGAGTGRLTTLLLARGLDVDAVEPDPRMRAVLARNNPGARCHASDSTALPVPEGSADAVVVADAWHWFDPEATMREVRRVLKPGGWLGLVWNVVAEPVEQWELALAGPDMYDRSTKGGPDGVTERLPLAARDELEFAQFDWVWDLTPVHRAANLATTSMAIAMAPDERQEWLEEIAQILIAEAFADPRVERVQATCDPRNAASSHVLRRAGMTVEGTLRHTMRARDGWRDSTIYSVVRNEWSS